MSIFIIILIVLVCIALSFVVLIQNPKGGGMSGTFGGFGNQVLGAKKSSDSVEKATWYLVLTLGVIVLASFVLASKSGGDATSGTSTRKVTNSVPAPAPAPVPAAGGNTPSPQPMPAPSNETPPAPPAE